ncbi:hypothetical protein APY94_05340 [Thermococcus celericrescens]|uniref:Uncharacterized protein n=1 Tax=Thermococcus celericrescens TaxID=227598 RepID=A0A100XY15_9EURY|nr:hypothetical protein [Thermococcus celericrescens]KUH33619.1 hypothetical protein APY94_05340 [Thermococcus celericrescens]
MGTEYFLSFIFDKSPEEIERFISSNFKVRLREPDESDRKFMEIERREFLKRGLLKYPVVFIKKGGLWSNNPLETSDESFWPIEYFDLRLFEVGEYSLLELNPQPRSSWMFVKSSDLLDFLKPFMREGFLMVSGYSDGIDLTEIGLKEDDELLLYMELVSIIEKKEEILPSGLTVVKANLLFLEDGLYELVERPGREEKEYVLIKSLEGYKILVSARESDLTDEECYLDLLEDKAWFSLEIVGLVFKRIGRKVEDEFLVKRAEEYFKAQVGDAGGC